MLYNQATPNYNIKKVKYEKEENRRNSKKFNRQRSNGYKRRKTKTIKGFKVEYRKNQTFFLERLSSEQLELYQEYEMAQAEYCDYIVENKEQGYLKSE